MKIQILLLALFFSLQAPSYAAAPTYPIHQNTCAPIEPSQNASPQAKFSQALKKYSSPEKTSKKLPDKPLFFLTLLLYTAALGLATALALGLIGIIPAGWILWGQLGFLFDALLLFGLVVWGDSWAALAVLLLSPFVLLALYGLGLLVGGIIAPVLWAWIVGALLVLFTIIVLLSAFSPKHKVFKGIRL